MLNCDFRCFSQSWQEWNNWFFVTHLTYNKSCYYNQLWALTLGFYIKKVAPCDSVIYGNTYPRINFVYLFSIMLDYSSYKIYFKFFSSVTCNFHNIVTWVITFLIKKSLIILLLFRLESKDEHSSLRIVFHSSFNEGKFLFEFKTLFNYCVSIFKRYCLYTEFFLAELLLLFHKYFVLNV